MQRVIAFRKLYFVSKANKPNLVSDYDFVKEKNRTMSQLLYFFIFWELI